MRFRRPGAEAGVARRDSPGRRSGASRAGGDPADAVREWWGSGWLRRWERRFCFFRMGEADTEATLRTACYARDAVIPRHGRYLFAHRDGMRR